MDTSRTITIELDSNAHNLPWRFAAGPEIKVHPGELAVVEYEIVNARDAAVTGQAVPSYGPQHAGQYFQKIECFCFTQQTLAPGETRRMPVLFVVDPKLPKDVNTIAVSYTFFEVPGRGGKTESVKTVLWAMIGIRSRPRTSRRESGPCTSSSSRSCS